jgi:hypothetical protein
VLALERVTPVDRSVSASRATEYPPASFGGVLHSDVPARRIPLTADQHPHTVDAQTTNLAAPCQDIHARGHRVVGPCERSDAGQVLAGRCQPGTCHQQAALVGHGQRLESTRSPGRIQQPRQRH